MSHVNRLKEALKKLYERRQEVAELWKKSPTTKLVLINTGVYCIWKLRLIPEEFLVKHFALERYNVEAGRLHTLVTYSFSHMTLFSYALDMLMIGFMGKGIQNTVGGKYVFWLYGLGALFGGLSSVAFQRPSPYIQPQVGPESCLGAFITFLAMLNPRQTFLLIVFPIPAWMLVTIIGLYSLIFDPQKKYFSGITAGIAVFQMRRVGFL